jgi:hypothetical protein
MVHVRIFTNLLLGFTTMLTRVIVSLPRLVTLGVPAFAAIAISATLPKRMILANENLGIKKSFAFWAAKIVFGSLNSVWLPSHGFTAMFAFDFNATPTRATLAGLKLVPAGPGAKTPILFAASVREVLVADEALSIDHVNGSSGFIRTWLGAVVKCSPIRVSKVFFAMQARRVNDAINNDTVWI